MNILMLGGAYLHQALEARGHKVLAPRREHPSTAGALWRKMERIGFDPDILIYLDDGNMPILLDPENASCPAIYYSIDTYCNPWHVGYAHGFDVTLVAQKDFISLFTNEGIDARWFPLFNPREENYALNGERVFPIAFVGTLGHKNNPDRAPFLKAFRRMQPLVLRQGDYARIFGHSQIALNQTAFSEINFRFFEAMACGAALLTEQCANGFEELFTPGENILPPYQRNNASSAAAIARDYLSRPALLKDIAAAGREHVRRYHGAQARSAVMESIALELLAANTNRAALAEGRHWRVRSAFAMLAVELKKPEMAVYRNFYIHMAGINK